MLLAVPLCCAEYRIEQRGDAGAAQGWTTANSYRVAVKSSAAKGAPVLVELELPLAFNPIRCA